MLQNNIKLKDYGLMVCYFDGYIIVVFHFSLDEGLLLILGTSILRNFTYS